MRVSLQNDSFGTSAYCLNSPFFFHTVVTCLSAVTNLHFVAVHPSSSFPASLEAGLSQAGDTQGCQKFRAQVAANFTKSRGRQRKSSPIFTKLKMHPKCLNLGALYVKLTKNHPNGRKNNRLSNFRKLRIITFEAFQWLYMTS